MDSPQPNEVTPLAQAMRETVEARYPGRLSAEESALLEKRIASLAETIERLRGYHLSNADEPDGTFRASEE